jgi:hypothetical protein
LVYRAPPLPPPAVDVTGGFGLGVGFRIDWGLTGWGASARGSNERASSVKSSRGIGEAGRPRSNDGSGLPPVGAASTICWKSSASRVAGEEGGRAVETDANVSVERATRMASAAARRDLKPPRP